MQQSKNVVRYSGKQIYREVRVSKKQIGLCLLGWLIQLQVMAAENMYSIISLGYSGVNYTEKSNQGFGYKLAFGYQFAPLCYVESVYQQLIHDNLYI